MIPYSITRHRCCGRAAAGIALLSLAAAGWTAVPVEESVASPRERAQPRQELAQQGASADRSSPGTRAGSGAGLGELFYELQILQQEVQELRGMVEEQGHRLDRLARDQQEQYLDLDRRMQALRGGGDGGARGSLPQDGESRQGERSGSPSAGSGERSSSPSGGEPASERAAYTRAFDLMKERQFDASVEAFDRLIADYPNGAYTPNAFYWLGELYLAQEQNEQARQSFAQVINLYPDHQKVPDALYKLGVVYHQLGDVGRARDYLSRVRRDYPQSSAAGLAETYLEEL